MSITASIVIVFVMLARIPLKKVPKIFSYVIWAVVLFRLVCPISFSSQLSVMGILRTPVVADNSVPFVPPDIVHTEYPQVDLPVPGVSEVINESLPQGQEQLVADPLEWQMAAATVLWLCGIAAMLIYSTVSLLLLRRKLISAVPLSKAVQNSTIFNPGIKAFSHESIYIVDHIPTPFVIGIIRPKIYLPSTLNERELSYVILHEQTHIRRYDHIVKMIAFLALVVHWFNPLVWVAFLLCVKDMEMSCDERVLREMGTDIKADYSTSLLSLAAGRRLINGSPLAFGEGNIKGRIKNVMNFRKPAFWVLVVAVIAVAVVCFCLMTNPATANISNNDVVDLSDIEEMNIGAEMPYLLYGDENIVVIQGTFGLLVYDLKDSLITNRISYSKLSSLGISMLHAAVAQDGTKVYLGNDERTGTELVFTHQYDIKTNTIRNLSKQPGNVYKLEVIIPSPGYNEQYDKYFDFNYLIGQSIIDFGESFLYLRANTDWSMKTLQIVSCQYKDGTSEILSIFSFPELNTNGKGLDNDNDEGSQTSLEPTVPELSPEQNAGADMAELDYASDNFVIFHGYFGLFVYDINSNKIVRSLDLKPIGCNFTQGDDYCDVTVSADGRTVQLHPMSSENMYVYSVPDNTLKETTHEQMENRFTDFIDIVEVVGLEKAGLHSHTAVEFDKGEYGYLYASDWTLGTLSYVRGDEIYRLFDFNVSLSAGAASLPTDDIEQSISNQMQY
jgi:beta-lactamase regulating signal transducer with metallopeptidase domain